MDKVTIDIKTEGGSRPSEIISDLRNAAEMLYYPMTLAGFWDYQADLHLCPQEDRREECPHKLPKTDPRYVEYTQTMQRDRNVNLEITFPHANVVIYLR